MSKTILFSTDFTAGSLRIVQTAIEDHPGEQLDIVLLHGIHLSDSITDLLFFSKSALIARLSRKEFENACHLLQQLFSKQINSFRIELFTGLTQSAFDALLLGLRADQIYIPEIQPKLSRKMSKDISHFIARSSLEKIAVPGTEMIRETETTFTQVNFAK